MIIRTIFFSLAALTLLTVSCTTHPAVNFDNHLTDDFFCFKDKLLKRIYGFGQLAVSVDGRRYNGSIDIDWKNDFFNASAYSPFGGLVASIDADSLQGKISDGKSSNHFFLDSVVDSIPFIVVQDLTFRDFICILTGRVPQSFNILSQAPDSVAQGRRVSRLFWRVDSMEIVAQIQNKSSQLTRLSVQNTRNQGWSLIFNGINQQLAQSIELRIDDRNYFSIHYERLKKESLKS
ncbi:MAG TPA: hypothetical protein VHP36_01405 [Chitinispirillaceae bacterium]|nr:hypothetical protein [Chitinispirillaceae bacterium]